MPRPQPVIMPQPTVIPAQQAQYNRYDQERFIRQKEGILHVLFLNIEFKKILELFSKLVYSGARTKHFCYLHMCLTAKYFILQNNK